MSTTDMTTMLFWLIGFIVILIIIDKIWYKRYKDTHRVDHIEKHLLRKNTSFHHTLPQFSSRGIVTTINDDNIFRGALLLISLRKVYCKLPIVVCYVGDDLNPHNKDYLESLQSVKLLNMSEKLDIPVEELRGPRLRALALIYSPFKEVLLVEPELLFFTDPEYLFNEPLYKNTGVLFWKDRPVPSGQDKIIQKWIKRLIPYQKEHNPILTKQLGTFQSRALLLFDKERHLSGLEKLELLTSEADTVYPYLGDDKETYWLALEIAKEDYTFVPAYPGVVGEYKGSNQLSGHVLYFDPLNQPLCWDGSLFEDSNREMSEFTHYAMYDENSKWDKQINKNNKRGTLRKVYIQDLSLEDRQVINSYAFVIQNIKARLYAKE